MKESQSYSAGSIRCNSENKLLHSGLNIEDDEHRSQALKGIFMKKLMTPMITMMMKV